MVLLFSALTGTMPSPTPWTFLAAGNVPVVWWRLPGYWASSFQHLSFISSTPKKPKTTGHSAPLGQAGNRWTNLSIFTSREAAGHQKLLVVLVLLGKPFFQFLCFIFLGRRFSNFCNWSTWKDGFSMFLLLFLFFSGYHSLFG